MNGIVPGLMAEGKNISQYTSEIKISQSNIFSMANAFLTKYAQKRILTKIFYMLIKN